MDQRTRLLVRQRAGHRCEYCQRAESQSPVARLQIEHILPTKHGGSDDPTNLALACIAGNLHKGANLIGIDPDDGQVVALFDPRHQPWEAHFAWNGCLLGGCKSLSVNCSAIAMPSSLAGAAKRRRAERAEGESRRCARATRRSGRALRRLPVAARRSERATRGSGRLSQGSDLSISPGRLRRAPFTSRGSLARTLRAWWARSRGALAPCRRDLGRGRPDSLRADRTDHEVSLEKWSSPQKIQTGSLQTPKHHAIRSRQTRQ